jgi:hypothetical protein
MWKVFFLSQSLVSLSICLSILSVSLCLCGIFCGLIQGADSAKVFDHHQVAASSGEEREEQPSAVRRDSQAGYAAG